MRRPEVLAEVAHPGLVTASFVAVDVLFEVIKSVKRKRRPLSTNPTQLHSLPDGETETALVLTCLTDC